MPIHEYAHHVHLTELSKGDHKLDRSHGHNFMRIYTALRAKAVELGLLRDIYDRSDELINDIPNSRLLMKYTCKAHRSSP